MLQHFSYDAFVHVLKELKLEFESRFKDIMDFSSSLRTPFMCHPVSSLTPVITALCPDRAGIESEIVELQANDTLQGELRSGVTHFWSLVSDIEYPLLKQCVQKVTILLSALIHVKQPFQQ
ncbi:unnamed protein product [Oncorhynchus mykiss]|uniref:Uncharacterized protein n=1 Tax=Oncorhynchus mykiss TaxID=8022 RepID=A0A060VW46_ONCMY|nr:unnamed protein product [Oncorhynchus mykiss]